MSILWKETVNKKVEVVTQDTRGSNVLVSASYQPPQPDCSVGLISPAVQEVTTFSSLYKEISYILKITQKGELFLLIRSVNDETFK